MTQTYCAQRAYPLLGDINGTRRTLIATCRDLGTGFEINNSSSNEDDSPLEPR